MEDEFVAFGDLCEQIDIPRDEIRLRYDTQPIAFVPGKDLKQAAGNAHAAFYWLVGVCRGAESDLFFRVDAAQFLLQEPRGVFLKIDFAFERQRPGLLRDFVRAGSYG